MLYMCFASKHLVTNCLCPPKKKIHRQSHPLTRGCFGQPAASPGPTLLCGAASVILNFLGHLWSVSSKILETSACCRILRVWTPQYPPGPPVPGSTGRCCGRSCPWPPSFHVGPLYVCARGPAGGQVQTEGPAARGEPPQRRRGRLHGHAAAPLQQQLQQRAHLREEGAGQPRARGAQLGPRHLAERLEGPRLLQSRGIRGEHVVAVVGSQGQGQPRYPGWVGGTQPVQRQACRGGGPR